jgi:hypothetical protein
MRSLICSLATILVLGFALTANAAFVIDENTVPEITGEQTSNSQILDFLEEQGYLTDDCMEVYKSDTPEGEGGGLGSDSFLFADEYNTTYSNGNNNAVIEFVGDEAIANPCWLLVKDGNHDPAWYLFDISGWDGFEDIEISGLWPDENGGGSISHVSILGGEGVINPPNGEIPEPASLLVWGVLGLVGAGAAWRRRRRTA